MKIEVFFNTKNEIILKDLEQIGSRGSEVR